MILTVYVYKNFDDYQTKTGAIVLNNVKDIAQSRSDGWLFIFDEQEHAFPDSVYVVIVKTKEPHDE